MAAFPMRGAIAKAFGLDAATHQDYYPVLNWA
jgi:hypothetical protein